MSDRILTTHTGSLPRPDDLIQMMWAKGDGIPVDEQALAERVASAVKEIVDKQIAAGVSVINDGEMSKSSYAIYVKDRLNGFGGESIRTIISKILLITQKVPTWLRPIRGEENALRQRAMHRFQ